MRRSSILFSVLCLALGFVEMGCDENTTRDNTDRFAVSAFTGSSVVPPTSSTASGSATFDLDNSTMQFSVRLSGISGVTAVHLHSGAPSGTGPSRVQLFDDPATGPIDGTLISDSFTTSDVQQISFSELVNQMRDGATYVDVHTVAFPDGEIRGQVQPVVE